MLDEHFCHFAEAKLSEMLEACHMLLKKAHMQPSLAAVSVILQLRSEWVVNLLKALKEIVLADSHCCTAAGWSAA